MPVRLGKDEKGCFARWGTQKKYHYKCGDLEAAKRAKQRAERQGRAIRATEYDD